MASIPFTLAALATSAVPGLVVAAVRGSDEDPDYACAIVSSDEGELLVRVPRAQAAEVRQSAELLGLAALTEGPRSRLPFEVPRTLGMTRAGETRAVVTTYLSGGLFESGGLHDDALLLQPIAEALAAIHELPRTVAQHGGLPVREARDLRILSARLVDRAEQTRMLPETVLRRWRHVLESAELWDFSPVMVHGSLDAEQFRVADDAITGIIGWSELSVGDAAADLSWLFAAGPEVFEAVLARYADLRSAGSVTHLRTRAALYHELEVARWLLHGVDAHDSEIVDDAVAMLDRLVGAGSVLESAHSTQHTHRPVGEAEAEALLAETPEVVDHLSDTAAYEALDEDRMFGFEKEFVETVESVTDTEDELDKDAPSQDSAAHTGSASLSTAAGLSSLATGRPHAHEVVSGDGDAHGTDRADVTAAAELAASQIDISEQVTQPFDSDDLPSAPTRLRGADPDDR